jgi:hypothetical protein
MIILTEQQANELKGNYGKFSRLEPVKIPFTNLYMVSESVLTDSEFSSVKDRLNTFFRGEVNIEYNEEGEAVSSVIKWDWLHDCAMRVIVPKSTLQANRQLLIFKSYAEIMGLPYEILPEEVHFYCNEILDDDKPTIEHFNLTVEER